MANTLGGILPGEANDIQFNYPYGMKLWACHDVSARGDFFSNNDTAVYLYDGTNSCQVTDNEIVDNNVSICLKGATTIHNLLTNNIVYGCTEGPDVDLWPPGVTFPHVPDPTWIG